MNYDIEGKSEGPQRQRCGSPLFYELLQEMAETHDIKSHDYANNNAPSANYEFAGTLASMFSHSPVDAGFVGRLGEKIYRLYVLESGNKIPKNESIADTERDIAVIATLWMAARKEKREKAGEIRETVCYGPERYSDIRGTPFENTKAANQEQTQSAAHDPELHIKISSACRDLTRVERLNLVQYLITTI